MYAYSSRTEKPICTKLGMLIPRDQEEILERSEIRKSVLCSRPGEDVLCSSETKHNRKTAPITKLFISASRLQKQGHLSSGGLIISTRSLLKCYGVTSRGSLEVYEHSVWNCAIVYRFWAIQNETEDRVYNTQCYCLSDWMSTMVYRILSPREPSIPIWIDSLISTRRASPSGLCTLQPLAAVCEDQNSFQRSGAPEVTRQGWRMAEEVKAYRTDHFREASIVDVICCSPQPLISTLSGYNHNEYT
jgi:hypothetical protein